jgi:transcriptional regulator with XRE-family HTH domain
MASESPAPPASAAASVGELLRGWRRRRRFSQLALALEASISARHLSFVETGRARPSRAMLLRLAERLEIPPRERNALLLAAGYAPEHPERALDGEAVREVREAADLFIRSLEPCPALIVDRHWTMVAGNRMLGVLLEGVCESLLRPPVNALRVSLHPRGLAPRIVNLPEWRADILRRLRREAEHSGDAAVAALHEELEGYPCGPTAAATVSGPGGRDGAALTVPLRLRAAGEVLSFISTTTVFGTAVDPVAAELTIEAFLPADAETRDALQRMAGATPPLFPV